MGNFTISEILTIALVILIVFGPNRLPELARKAGSLMAKARGTVAALREEFTNEYTDVVAPMREVRDDLKAVRTDISDSVTEFAKDVKNASDVSAELSPVTDEAAPPPADPPVRPTVVPQPEEQAAPDPSATAEPVPPPDEAPTGTESS